MHLAQFFRRLTDFETRIGLLYERFEQLFAAEPRVAAVFGRLALDERTHATMVEYQRRLVSTNHRMFANAEVDIDELQLARDQVDALLASDRPFALDEAIGFALKLETSAAESHHRSALSAANPELAGLLDSLSRGDKEHMSRLMELAASETRRQE